MDLIEIGWGGVDWIDLVQDRDQWWALVNTVMNLRVPKNAGKFLSSCTIGSFSRMAHLHELSYMCASLNMDNIQTEFSYIIITVFVCPFSKN
jgi:hypothetical protein